MNMHVREIPGTQPTGGKALEGGRGLVLGWLTRCNKVAS